MIPFTTCMKFNRKRVNRGSLSKQQQQQHQFSQQQQHSQQPQLVIIPADQPKSTLVPPNVNLITDIQSVPPFLQCPENRLLLTLRRSKAVQRSIHIDPIALLDYSYHGVTDRFLKNASNWSFNSFTLDTLTGGHSLSSLLFYLFNKYNFISEFKLEIINVWKCFRLFENGYHDTNPYHNSVHAADVTQAMHCFIEEEKIGQHLTPMEKMCSLLAAVAHDLDHPGVNQHFLIATKSHLASLYNNLSVLESHHWRFAMSCLKESGIFSHFDDNQWSMVQFLLRSLILATDVTQQTNYLRRFRDALEKGTIKMTSPDDRLFIMQIALKCADLGNPGRPWILSKRWTTQICNEFYRQGDYERQLKMKVTPIFDRRTASVARIQTDFYRNIVSPLYQLWDQFLGSKLSRRIMFNLKFNDSQWFNCLQKVNVKRRHSYETMNEKKRKAKDISKSLDDIMSIEEISLDELKDMPKVGSMDDKGLTCCLPILGSPCSSSSLSSSPKVTLEPARFGGLSGLRKELITDEIETFDDDKGDDEDDGERIHIGKKQCIGPNGCGTPSPPREKRSSLPIISIQSLGSPESSQAINLSSNCPNVFQSQSSHQLSNLSTISSSQTTIINQPQTQSTFQVSSQTSCSSSPTSHHHSRRHSYHNNNNNNNNNSNNNNASNNHHYRHHHHRHSIQSHQQPTITQPCLPYISVSQPISGSTDCTYGSDSGDTELLPEGSTYGTYTGLPRVVEQLMNYEQSIDKVTCLPHSLSTLPGYPTSTSSTNTPSYPSQSIVDTAQFCRGRRGSAPGCIGIYTGCELAAAALVFLHGTVSENEDSSLPEPDVPAHSAHLSSSLIHLKCPSLLKPSVTSSSQSSPSSSPPHTSSYNLKQQASSSIQRPSLFLTKTNNNNLSNSNNDADFTSNNNCNNNTDNNNGNNKGQKRRSSFPVCDSGHYFGYLATEGGSKLNSRKSPSSYLHGTAKSSSPRLKGRSLELLMSSLTAKTKLLTNQSCSLDSASECRSWLVKREERRGSIPQDILIHSLANYSANAL